MKIFTATLATETNTAAVVPTGRVDFEAYGVYRRDASRHAPTGVGVLHAEIQRLAAADGHTVVESLAAVAQPSGPTLRALYEEYRDAILDDLRAALPVDAVALILHGAMVAQGYDDCEGDLIERVRDLVGPTVPIGAELDLHCHTTARMLRHADLLIAYKEYPHTDSLDRLRELYALLMQQAAGRIRPTTAMVDCRMIGLWHTTREPMISFVQRLQALEGSDGVLSISLGHGFPWGDVAECGARLWVITDNDLPKAEALAQQLDREFRALRLQTYEPPLSIPAALAEALATTAPGPVVLADIGDNAGGGAMSDSTFVLQALLDAGIGNAVIGSFWDIGAVALCQSAGVGAQMQLRIGGKCGPMSGAPVDVPVTVRAIVERHGQNGLGSYRPLGIGVWVRTSGGIDIALNTQRAQVLSRECFESLGITLTDKQLIVVKSTQHFHAEFAPIASKVLYMGTPGSTSQAFAEMHFSQRDNHFWPRVEDPWS